MDQKSKRSIFQALNQLSNRKGDGTSTIGHLLWASSASKLIPSMAPKYDDAAVAILCAAVLEQHLEQAIRTHFVISNEDTQTLFNQNSGAAMATLGQKINVGYALGIYDTRMKDDLSMISRIRNVFGHCPSVISFNEQAIVDACDTLIIPTVKTMPPGIVFEWPPSTTRDKFVATAQTIYEYLLVAAHYSERHKTPINFAGQHFSFGYREIYEGTRWRGMR